LGEMLSLSTPSPARKLKVLSQLASVTRYIHTHNAVVGSVSYNDILIDVAGDVKLNMSGPLLRAFLNGQGLGLQRPDVAASPFGAGATSFSTSTSGISSPWEVTLQAQRSYREALEALEGDKSGDFRWEGDVYAFGCMALRLLSSGKLVGPPFSPQPTDQDRYRVGTVAIMLAESALGIAKASVAGVPASFLGCGAGRPMAPPASFSTPPRHASPPSATVTAASTPTPSRAQTLPYSVASYDTLWMTSCVPPEMRGAVSNILISCVHPDRTKRPTMAEVDHVLLGTSHFIYTRHTPHMH
jgi:serine/threonine protein kinase